MKLSKILLVPVAAALLSTGCYSAQKAVPRAAAQSGCPAKKIKVLKETDTTALLDVCGEKQNWSFHPIDGYEYAGNQPTKRTAKKK